MRGKISLEHPERFSEPHRISRDKLNRAIEKALDKLEKDIPRWTDRFAGTSSVEYKYQQGNNNNWICGMQTGLYWLAYELSGNKKFRDTAEKHLSTYQERFDQKIGMNDHDVGFVYKSEAIWGKEDRQDRLLCIFLFNSLEVILLIREEYHGESNNKKVYCDNLSAHVSFLYEEAG